MKNSKKKKMSYGHGGGYNKPMQKAKKGMKYKKGGKLKPVDSKKNPGLAKLPTDVRNNMGFMEMGGKMKGGEAAHGMKMKKAPGGMKTSGMMDRRRMMNNMMTYMGGGKMKTTYKSGGTYRQLD